MKQKLADRIAEAIGSTGKKPAEVARIIGKTPAAIYLILDGTTKSIKSDTSISLSQLTGYSPTWLADGTGPKRMGEVSHSANSLVPLISWVAAGEAQEASDPYPPGAAEEWYPCPAKSFSPMTFCLKVVGTSMISTRGISYPPGCIIFVDPERRSPNSGQRIIAKLTASGQVTFKVFREEDGSRWLSPLNYEHLQIREPFSVIGTIIGHYVDDLVEAGESAHL